jgi:hypothetical protein
MRRGLLSILLAAIAAAGFAQAQAPAQAQASKRSPSPQSAPTTLSGVLAFVDEMPAIKTESATILLSMPRFFEYAYQEGFKAGMAIKARGRLLDKQDRSGRTALIAEEVAIGGKTYVIVLGGPEGGTGKDAAKDRSGRGADPSPSGGLPPGQDGGDGFGRP